MAIPTVAGACFTLAAQPPTTEALPTLGSALYSGRILVDELCPHTTLGQQGQDLQYPPRIPTDRLWALLHPQWPSGELPTHPTLVSQPPDPSPGPGEVSRGCHVTASCDGPQATVHPDCQPGNRLWLQPLPSFPQLAS